MTQSLESSNDATPTPPPLMADASPSSQIGRTLMLERRSMQSPSLSRNSLSAHNHALHGSSYPTVSPGRNFSPHTGNSRTSPRLLLATRDRASSFTHYPSSSVGIKQRSYSLSSPVFNNSVGMSSLNSPGLNPVPFIPNLNPNGGITPPCTPNGDIIGSTTYGYSSRAAVEAAVANERARARELEQTEKEYTKEQLHQALRKERSHSSRLSGELAALRSEAVASQAEAEVHEEGRINGLMRRLDFLQKEKGRIIVELEREEEMLTNTLQKKLNEVRREKSLLEKQIEREHSSNSDLKARLDSLMEAASVSTASSSVMDEK